MESPTAMPRDTREARDLGGRSADVLAGQRAHAGNTQRWRVCLTSPCRPGTVYPWRALKVRVTGVDALIGLH
jgi:hypothetical protein